MCPYRPSCVKAQKLEVFKVRGTLPEPSKAHCGRSERLIFLFSDFLHVFTQAGALADVC